MRLSEAIRLGSMLTPQGFGSLHGIDGQTDCALGAARRAAGYGPDRGRDPEWSYIHNVLWPWLNLLMVWCPECGGPGSAMKVIVHLNDTHMWTRERIAGWVEQEEPREGEAEPLAPGVAEPCLTNPC